ncbi:MAG TPA: TIGR02680 family protein, partial [Pseudonocardiaceae bacterium]
MSATDEDRWRLHRGGIVNIWQYDEQEFDLSGGRAVFQGTNGSGKSRTLELLLPLCLDGDLRQLGSKGFDTVSIRRLMLDDYDGGPNRIGYAWIELRRVDSLSHEHFLTCGIGIKASASAQQVSDSWRFITPERVGAGLKLIGRDRVPVGQAQLREDIGADAVLDDVTFRARIAELVYGMPTARYGDLLHLQRTLRNPDVGLKVLDGQLEQILSDALPPLDVTMIEQLAGSFEDLESIRENITRLSTADKALSAFLGGYGGYALAALRAATERARDTATRLAADRTEVRTLAEKLDRQRARHIGAEETVAAKESRVDDVDRALDALKELPAYLGLRDLGDRERLVAAARTAADDVLETAGKQRAHTERAVDAVLAMLRRLGEDAEAAARLADTTRSRLAEAGLDTALAPRVPAAPEPVARTLRELVRAKPDPEAAPVEVERRMPPSPRPDVLERDLTAAAEQAAELITIAGQRAALALSLRERAVELDRDRAHLDGLRLAARQAQLAATEAAGRRNEAAQRLEDAAAEWRERATNWLAGLGGEAGEPPTIEELRTG